MAFHRLLRFFYMVNKVYCVPDYVLAEIRGVNAVYFSILSPCFLHILHFIFG